MKLMLLFPFVLLLGLVIGGWAPKEELRTAKKEMKELQKRAERGDRENRVNAFTRMVKIPDRATKVTRASEKNAPEQDSSASNKVTVSASGGSTNEVGRRGGRRQRREMSPEDLKARIDEAKELWKTRVEIARAQWHNRLKFTAAQAVLFDEAVNTMNERLYYAAQDFADMLAVSDALTPEDTTRAVNDMTSVLADTYNEFHEFVTDEQRGEVSMIELTDFIDPGVAEPLIAVQDKLENAAPRRPPSGNRR
ncbi:MAG: hypothetical protein PHG71_05315 [Kiritimatiellae bacterium]|nr:hypothetical protein [Kiritimatiellia bacterium]MDD4622639.1 hypothetical protein [Kiritimatiellia bacterium]